MTTLHTDLVAVRELLAVPERRQLDLGHDNPRLQCGECGRWMRLHGRDKSGSLIQRFYGSCEVTHGDHPCNRDVCSRCCPDKCRSRLDRAIERAAVNNSQEKPND